MIELPLDFKNRMKNDLGDEYEAFIEAYSSPPLSGFRVNTLKLTPEELLSIFPYSNGNVPWCDTGFYYDSGFGKHPCHRAGLFYSQEPSAMISAELLNVEEGDVVLDLCAAPGGKSTHLASKLNNTGLLVSNEIVRSRAMILRENIERMGISNCVVTNMSPDEMELEFSEFFDKILVDAPCSGEGMFRKDDEAIRAWSIEHTESCAQRQQLILTSAAKMLRDGGSMVYSTCTFAPVENEENILQFVKMHPEFTIECMEHIYPHSKNGEGHFAARLKKSGEGTRKERKPLLKEADSSLFRSFEKESLNTKLEGSFLLFGENMYLIPKLFGDIKSIKIILPGLHLGEVKKNRFEPSLHLALALKKEDFKVTYTANDKETELYYQGNVVNAEAPNGWGAMLYHKYPIGWFKSVGGQLKNHYPKKFRG
ncbi:MAG: RsmB/NOP family class I SAM-dependent RNA methyltransferase [Clostridia bacterium]|nr:RsmB/NOP family class I SAM-dependent RNA methyltransferase [Clostridia bacterium]